MRARTVALLAILASVRPHGPAVLVLRGDSYRAGFTLSTGCVLEDRPIRNQLKALESMEQSMSKIKKAEIEATDKPAEDFEAGFVVRK